MNIQVRLLLPRTAFDSSIHAHSFSKRIGISGSRFSPMTPSGYEQKPDLPAAEPAMNASRAADQTRLDFLRFDSEGGFFATHRWPSTSSSRSKVLITPTTSCSCVTTTRWIL